MVNERLLAKQLLNAVWNEDVELASIVLSAGADPNWYFNGYPILIHAVFTRNEEMVMLLLDYGALQASQALGFALEQGIGEMVMPLAFLGVIPKQVDVNVQKYGAFPHRYVIV